MLNPATSLKSGSNRLQAIDVLRGMAAASVFLFHLGVVCLPASGGVFAVWQKIWSYGYLGVPVFFVLSGFCITMAWSQSKDWRFFAVKRFRRIYPPYWGSLLLIFVLACLIKILTGINDIATFPTKPGPILATATLSTDPVTFVKTMNWVYWTLSYEVAFYLVMGILLLAAPAFRVRALAGVHLLICAAACLISSTTQTPWFFVNLWPLFGAGAAVYLLPSDPRTGLLMLGASCFSMTVAPSGDYGLYWLAGSLTCCVCYAVLKGYWHSSETLLSRFGAMSYSLYLIHIPVGVYVGNKIFIEFKGGGLQEILRQGLIFIFTCVAAWGFHLLCEKPFIRPTRNFPRG